jgi:O-succinylhomoserine sulfhydrylase
MSDTPNPTSPNLRPQTILSRGGTERSPFGETSEAIFMTSGYVYKRAEDAERAFAKPGTAYVYSRYANPTVTMFEERLRLIEGAEACRGLASGMAAVFAALACYVKAGDRVVTSRALFGSCDYIVKQILPGYGVETELVDGRDLNAWEKALSRPAKAVFVESISNPALEIIDIEAVAKLTHRAGGLLFVDNVFATPLLMRPLRLGADIVIYSATKHIDGQGRSLGGAILGPAQWMADHLANFLRHTGPSLSPFNAWVLLKGMETLDLRIERMSRSASEVAAFLERQPQVGCVLYPGLASHPQRGLAARQLRGGGTLLAFSVKGGKDAAFRCLNALKLILISNNLGDARSLVTHPATTTHFRLKPEERAALGIDDGLIRLSVGLEDPADLTDDLGRALAAT